MNDRKDCPMRHENGNCLTVGGCCPAVNDEICCALQMAYEAGKRDAIKTQEPRVMTLEDLQAIETPWNRNTPPYLWLEDRFGQNSNWMCWRDIHSVVSSSEATVWKQNYGSMRRVWTLQPTPEQMRDTPWEGENETM